MPLFGQIYQLVKKIPLGKVTTYGALAKAIGLKDNRQVGWAMHGNQDPAVPCHRVVFANGQLAPGYVFGGEKIQKAKLKKEGVKFLKKNQVDLKKSLFVPAAVEKIKQTKRQPNQRVNTKPN